MSAVSLRATNDVVSLVIEVDGEALPGYLPVESLEVIYQANRIPYARLKIGDGAVAEGDFAYSSGGYFVPGNVLSVVAGYRDATQRVFSGIVLRQKAVVRRGRSWLE